MTLSNIFSVVFRSRVVGCAVFLMILSEARAQYDPDWGRSLRVGILTGFNIKAGFSTAPGAYGLSSAAPAAGRNNNFDDGFVRVDSSGNEGGLTWFWGYENESQYDADAQQILMHRTTGFETGGGRLGRNDDAPYVGLDVGYGGMLWRRGWVRLGWDFGFNFVPISIGQGIRPQTVSASRSTYAFDLGEVIPPLAPYQGTFQGPGALISDDPILIGSEENESEEATLTGTRSLDVSLFLFKLGPTVFMDLTPRWAVSLSAGPAMGIVTGSHRFNEVLTFSDDSTSSHRGRVSDTDLLWGAYVSGTVMYHAVPNGDFYLSLQYAPLGRSTFAAGGRSARLDLSAPLFVSVGVNWPF